MQSSQRFFKKVAENPIEYRTGQCRERTGRSDDAPSCDPSILQELTDARKAQGRMGKWSSREPLLGTDLGQEGIVPSVVGRIGFQGADSFPRELHRPYADVDEIADSTVFQKPMLQWPTGYDELVRRTIYEQTTDKRYGSLIDRTDEGYSTGNEVVYAPRRPLYPLIAVPTNKPLPPMNYQGDYAGIDLTNQGFAQGMLDGQDRPIMELQRKGGFDYGTNQMAPINGGKIAPDQVSITDCNRPINLKYLGPRNYQGGWSRLKQAQTDLAFVNLGLDNTYPAIKKNYKLFEPNYVGGVLKLVPDQVDTLPGNQFTQNNWPTNFEADGRHTQVFTDEGDAVDRYWTKRSMGEWRPADTKESLQEQLNQTTNPALLKQVQASAKQIWRDVGWSPVGTAQARLDVGQIVRHTQGGLGQNGGMDDASFYSTMHFGGGGLGRSCGRALFATARE